MFSKLMLSKVKVLSVLSLLIVGITAVSSVHALPSAFEVTVNTNPLKVSEFADVTIKAVDENGVVDTSYTNADIWIEVEGFSTTDPDIVLPGGGVGFFEPADQGLKIFSKGLTIKKPGTYTLKVADIYDTSISGEVEIQVLSENSGPAAGGIMVTSPSDGSTESSNTISVVGTTEFANTPIVIFIDGNQFQEGMSDTQGNFNIAVSGLTPGAHTLDINALDLEDTVVASSDTVNFTIVGGSSEIFATLAVMPSRELSVNDQATITVTTKENADSVMLTAGSLDAVPMNKVQGQPGKFRKVMVFEIPGNYSLSTLVKAGSMRKDFPDLEVITVRDEARRITTLDNVDTPDKNRSDLTWTYEGTIDYFKVRYGTNRNNLRLSLTTSNPEGTLILADPTVAYYAQVFPVDENAIIIGEPSQIIEIGPLKEPEPICGNRIIEAGETCDDGNILNGDGCAGTCQIEQPVCGNAKLEAGEACDDGNLTPGDACSAMCTIEPLVQPVPNPPAQQLPEQPSAGNTCYTTGIRLASKQINGSYYIDWSAVPLAREYIVYRAESQVNDVNMMSIVGRTSDTQFEYPFDPNSEVDKFARYAVEAVCDETGEQKQVGDVTMVKVGPENTIFFLGVLLFMGLAGWRVVRS